MQECLDFPVNAKAFANRLVIGSVVFLFLLMGVGGELTLSLRVIGAHEICHREVSLPLTAPESRGPTLKRRVPRQAKVLSINSTCICLPHWFHSHMLGQLPLKLGVPPGTVQMMFGVDLLAGGVGCLRDGPGGWEGERRPNTPAKASSESQGEEGKCRPA